jgi:hypothetical protein
MSRPVRVIAASKVDAESYLALKDICDLTRDQNVRVVGGQMIEILRTAFPTPGLFARSTRDADAAIESELASTGNLHETLTAAGYTATHGNSYLKERQKIDLIVGNLIGKFKSELLGGRAFDSAPGIQAALNAEPLVFDVEVFMPDESSIRFQARTPTVELATCIKTFAYRSRLRDQDLVDLYYLLKIVEHHGPDSLGGWKLNQPAQATRLDAQKILQTISERLFLGSKLPEEIKPSELKALLVKWVAKP